MTYGVTINGTDTKTTHGLILLADLSIQEAQARTAMVEVPGRSGFWDFTEVLANGPTFGNVQITFTLFKRVKDPDLQSLRNTLATAYNGQIVQLVLPTTPSGYCYHGRMSVGSAKNGQIAFSVDAEPTLYAVEVT